MRDRMSRRIAPSLAALALAGLPARGAAPEPGAAPVFAFSSLRAKPAAAVRAQTETWLKSALGEKFDAGAFAAAWPAGAPVQSGLVAAAALAVPEVAGLPGQIAPPGEVPAVLRDKRLSDAARSDLAALYAKSCAARKAYEESAMASRLAVPELVADPAGYYFYRAVAEHATLQRGPAEQSLARLLDDVADVPDRYRVVARLLQFDVMAWPKDDKDLSNIGRLMDNSGRRLELARGGAQTQEIQKKIVFRLDEKIKELEAQAKRQQQPGPPGPGQPGGQCPAGAPADGQTPGAGKPSSPQQDSFGGRDSGDGQVDVKKLRQYEAVWGKLPEQERAKIAQDFVREMPAKYKPMIVDYFRSLNRLNGFKPQ